MINPTGKKLEKLLFGMFDDAIQGVDTYNHNGSMWLIFTDEMKWVVEYTKEQTLWYNYYFFKNEMEMINLDCVDNKDLIQKWFESRFLNKNEVKETDKSNSNYRLCVEDTIQNGVKHTQQIQNNSSLFVEHTIQNGVKDTTRVRIMLCNTVEDTIQNGVKETNDTKFAAFEDAIQNGIKETKGLGPSEVTEKEINNTIQNGVKEIKEIGDFSLSSAIFNINCKKTIRDGVKHTKALSRLYANPVEDTIQNEVKRTEWYDGSSLCEVEETIKNGVKKILTPGEDGDIIKTLDFMDDNNTSNVPHLIGDVIQNVVKKTKRSYESSRKHRTKDTIQNGVKRTKCIKGPKFIIVEDTIQNGVKYARHEFSRHLPEVEDTIQNGVKDMKESHFYRKSRITDVTQNGVKEVIELPELNPDLNGYGEYYFSNKNMKYPFNDIVEDVIKENNKLS